MTHGTGRPLRFSRRRGRKVEADFQGGLITGNGGVMRVSERDRRLGPGTRIARLLGDSRRSASCRHGKLNLLRQRLHALCLGHEDPDDHDELRHDAALQAAVDRDTVLVSASTLYRFDTPGAAGVVRQGLLCPGRSAGLMPTLCSCLPRRRYRAS